MFHVPQLNQWVREYTAFAGCLTNSFGTPWGLHRSTPKHGWIGHERVFFQSWNASFQWEDGCWTELRSENMMAHNGQRWLSCPLPKNCFNWCRCGTRWAVLISTFPTCTLQILNGKGHIQSEWNVYTPIHQLFCYQNWLVVTCNTKTLTRWRWDDNVHREEDWYLPIPAVHNTPHLATVDPVTQQWIVLFQHRFHVFSGWKGTLLHIVDMEVPRTSLMAWDSGRLWLHDIIRGRVLQYI